LAQRVCQQSISACYHDFHAVHHGILRGKMIFLNSFWLVLASV
jgi:hypothetical protein